MISPDLDSLDDKERRQYRSVVRFVSIVVPGVVFVGLLAWGLFTKAPPVEEGTAAPPFELELIAGEDALEPEIRRDQVLSSDELTGTPVVINFWASWCIPCREEAPRLERAWRYYKKSGVMFVGINIQDAKGDALGFIDEFDVTYPQVRASGFQTMEDFDTTGVPETYFIDHEWTFIGIVSGPQQGAQEGIKVLGAVTTDQLASNIDLLLARAGARADT